MVVLGVLCAGAQRAAGQVGLLGPDSRYELADTVQVDRAEGEVATQLQRVKAFLADRQWDEAVQTLRQVMENSGEKLWPVSERRFITVRDYCHLELAALPPEALALYRARVDASARQRYDEGIARHDRRPLLDVVRQAFASSSGDDALLALGEMALESGDPAGARAYWEKILRVEPPPDARGGWLGYPNSDLDPAAVRARLVLASILEGSLDRAKAELVEFKRLHPDSRGRFGGQEANFADALAAMLGESTQWPGPKPDGDWPTFAGTPWREKIAPQAVDVGEVAWRVAIPDFRGGAAPGVGLVAPNSPTAPAVVPASALADGDLAFHPIRLGNLVLVNQGSAILALDLATGKPAWGQSAEVFRDASPPLAPGRHPVGTLGVPRFTVTAFEGRLYARLGNTLTSQPRDGMIPDGGSYLVCLDLTAQGRLAWKVDCDRDGWAFEG
ncbi:MAG: hypothetical protein NTW96_05110, partial [Planctomycetia bacterium]|nr:hypothetical protein [Planctomycetia bacterium]